MKMEYKVPKNNNKNHTKMSWDVVTIELAWCIVLRVGELAAVGQLALAG